MKMNLDYKTQTTFPEESVNFKLSAFLGYLFLKDWAIVESEIIFTILGMRRKLL